MLHNKGNEKNMYMTKKTISSNGKELIVVLWNVHINKEKTIIVKKKEKSRCTIYIYCEKIFTWHNKFIMEHKINNPPY